MTNRNQNVDTYIENEKQWQQELMLLREIVLSFDLEEEYKWKQPCYTNEGKNIVILTGFKGFCVLGFFKGSLLKDEQQLLVSPGENTASGRQLRFKSPQEVQKLEPTIRAYIEEAIRVEMSGQKVTFTTVADLDVPEELQWKFDADATFKTAFESLTPGRQKAYIQHFASAKQSDTRVARIAKVEDRIRCGQGLLDCTCGHTKKPPGCDGSHKYYN
jgi:uncharacterized protein YdeI (YjbR/CyaY-like superfamily)